VHALHARAPGDTVKVEVLRGGAPQTRQVRLTERPASLLAD
jgi:S1-C subfamily serine protease